MPNAGASLGRVAAVPCSGTASAQATLRANFNDLSLHISVKDASARVYGPN